MTTDDSDTPEMASEQTPILPAAIIAPALGLVVEVLDKIASDLPIGK